MGKKTNKQYLERKYEESLVEARSYGFFLFGALAGVLGGFWTTILYDKVLKDNILALWLLGLGSFILFVYILALLWKEFITPKLQIEKELSKKKKK